MTQTQLVASETNRLKLSNKTLTSSQATIIPFGPKTVDQLAPEEESFFVKVGKDKIDRFSDDNLQTYKNERPNIKGDPYVYGSRRLLNLAEEGTVLLDCTDVDSDNEYSTQLSRFRINQIKSEIEDNVRENGFSLTEKHPIMVIKLPTGKYIVIDGRTRFTILRDDFGIKNIIADVFECPMKDGKVDMGRLVIFAIRMNQLTKPHGEATYADIGKAITFLIENKDIIKFTNDTEGNQKMRDQVEAALEDMYCNIKNLSDQKHDQIVHNAMYELTGDQQVVSFPNGSGVEDWLEKNNYISDPPVRECKYISFAMVTPNAALSAFITAQSMIDKDPDIKEIKLVGYVGVIKSDNPEKAWQDNFKLKEKVIEMEKELSKARFGGVIRRSPKIKLWGIIPQVYSLDNKYPMGKICHWPKDSAEG